MTSPLTAERLAVRFHEAYERLAPDHGYETREASAKPWAEVPANNRALMTAVCAEVMLPLASERMYQDAYFAVQRVLDKALGEKEEDSAGGGIAGDVFLLAEQRDEARAEVARLTALITAPDGTDIPAPFLLEMLAMANHAEGLDVADYELLDHHRTETYRMVAESVWSVARESVDDLKAELLRSGESNTLLATLNSEAHAKLNAALQSLNAAWRAVGELTAVQPTVLDDARRILAEAVGPAAVPAAPVPAVCTCQWSPVRGRLVCGRCLGAAPVPAPADERCSSKLADLDGITLYPCVADAGHEGEHWSRHRVREWEDAEQRARFEAAPDVVPAVADGPVA